MIKKSSRKGTSNQLPSNQQPRSRPRHTQSRLTRELLLDAFSRMNRLLADRPEPQEAIARGLELLQKIFACDQALLFQASDPRQPYSIAASCCRPNYPLEKTQIQLSVTTAQRLSNQPSGLALSAGNQEPIPFELSARYRSNALLATALQGQPGTSQLLLLNQCSHPRLWHQDELQLFQELAGLLQQALQQPDQTRQYLDALPAALIGVDPQLRVKEWSQAAEQLSGVSRRQALGQQLFSLLPKLPLSAEQLTKALNSMQTTRLERSDWQLQGRKLLVDICLYPLAGGGGLLQLEDTTDQVQLEEWTVQQEKMISVGNLAAGVAQEINNPLAGILQNLQVLRNRLHPNLPKNIELAQKCGVDIDQLDDYLTERGVHSVLNAAIESGQKATDIVRNMLDFSRKDNSGFHYFQLDQLLDKAVELASSNFSLEGQYDFRQIEIVRQYQPDLPELFCSPGQLQQVFLNLLNNGAHAMTKRLRFWEKNSATLPKEERPRFILRLQQHSESLICEIEDNGCGMSNAVRKRVFEPFYTTRKTRAGSGLGMSICYFIITKNHNGRMSVDSMLDVGTRFRIELPL